MTVDQLLEIRDLSVRFERHAVPVIRQVSFDIQPGETVGLVGESGSGKSTIIRSILGLERLVEGEIRFDGRIAQSRRLSERRTLSAGIQAVFQDPYGSLDPRLTVAQVVAEPLVVVPGVTRLESRDRVIDSLARVGLPASAAERYPRDFSGGQRQRIAIARALIRLPKLVLCDEAVSALDLSTQAQVLELLLELQRDFGLSYLFVSHDLSVVRYIAHRIVVLYHGQVMEIGDAKRLSAAPEHPYTQALLQAVPIPDPIRQADRRAARQRSRVRDASLGGASGQGCPFAGRCPHAIDICREKPVSLRPGQGGGLVACHRAGQLDSLVGSR